MTEATELRRRVAQLLVVRASGHLSDGQRRYPRWELTNAELRRLLAEGVGGVILLGASAAELGQRTRQLASWSDQPLLLCADVEEGVGQRFEGASWLVPPLALGRIHAGDPASALALAERYGRCSGREARALGLNLVLGPVCDVNNNPDNPVINVRAWGEDPASAGALAAAFLSGAQAEGVLCCAKHFPGHGDTSSDSHLELPLLSHSRERLERIELPPFRQAIAAGVASVMTAHLLLPSLDGERPATLSSAVLTGLLRQELGFNGLVVTDALVMEAISGRYGAGEAAVLALEAGADLVLMPADADAAIEAIVAAISTGRLSDERIETSLQRRRQALARCGRPADRLAPSAGEPQPGQTPAPPWPSGPEPGRTTASAGRSPAAPMAQDPAGAIERSGVDRSRIETAETKPGELHRRELDLVTIDRAGGTTRAIAPLAPQPAGPASWTPSAPLGALSNGPLAADQALALELVQRSLVPQGPRLSAETLAGGGLNLIRVDTVLGCPFLAAGAPALVLPAEAGLSPCLIDGQSPSPWSDDPAAPLALERLAPGPVLLQLFVRGNPFRGSAGGGGEPWPAVIAQLQAAGRLAGLAVYGSPYLWQTLRPLLTAPIAAAYSPGQMPLAQSELLRSLGLGESGSQAEGFTD
ncbi:MAG: glycoside hydrolase family 3 N-terminal domain-containing protein [Cyanobium sp.]